MIAPAGSRFRRPTASNDPIVVTLLGIAFGIPYASKGYAFASLPPPNAA